jgi:hypothetical protein
MHAPAAALARHAPAAATADKPPRLPKGFKTDGQ